MLICLICLISFVPTNKHQKYCSKSCCSKAYRNREHNKQTISKQAKQWAFDNQKRLKEYKHNWYKLNKKRTSVQRREYRASRAYEKATYDKIYRAHNRDRINLYIRNKKKKDIMYRLRCKLRSRIQKALKKNWKSGSSIDLLGCSIEKYKSYLESLFQIGMTWNNQGKWHIDHKRPISSFNLINSSQQRKCFNYKNTQPLWQRENLAKGDKYDRI